MVPYDIDAVRKLPVSAVMLPKAEDPAQVSAVVAGHAPLLALVETAKGIANTRAIAVLPSVERLVLGR